MVLKTENRSAESASPPWPVTGTVLIALTALAFNEDAVARLTSNVAFASLPVLAPIVLVAIAILASLLSNFRLDRGRPAVWTVRLCVYGALVLYALATTANIRAFFYMDFVARISGLCFISETALQHWQRPPRGESRGAILVFLAAIVFVLAARTRIQHYVKYFTPPFILMLVMAMRASRQRADHLTDGFHPWIAAFFAATLIGGMGSLAIAANSNELTKRLLAFMKPSNSDDFTDANARPVLGKSFNTPLSQKRVMRIEGAMAERHMRGQTFEAYATNGGWGPSQDARARADATIALKARPGGERLTVTPLIDNLPILYVPLHLDGLDAKFYQLEWIPSWGGPICVVHSTGGTQPYQITIVNETHPGPLSRIMTPEIRKYCLDLPPEFNPKVREIARQIAHGASSEHYKLEEVRKYLWRNHSYSLEIDLGPGDPVANFLLQKRNGHCQYFASSAVLLLRCMNVPARYVTGYYAHESPGEELVLVRQRDAHAWAEVWIEGEGWVTFDPTPGSGMPGQSGGISFWDRTWERMGDFAEAFGAWLQQAPFSKLATLIGTIVALIFAIRWLREWRAAVAAAAPRVHYASPGKAFEALAAGFDAWLKRQGTPCPPQRPWLDHLADLKRGAARPKNDAPTKMPIDLAAAEDFARAYTAARFGGDINSVTVDSLNTRLRQLSMK